MGGSIKVLLVVTHAPGLKGSMARFADMVEETLTANPNPTSGISVSRMNLALPRRLVLWLPSNIQTWLNHLWLITFARWRMGRSDADLVHLLDGSYGYLLKNFTRIPAIATVHDLIPMMQQEGHFGQGRGSVFARKIIQDVNPGLRNCVHLLADSANTADDLATFGVTDRENVTVVPLALAPSLTASSDLIQEGRDQASLGSNLQRDAAYILHIGNNGHYKNRAGVLRIFARVRALFMVRLVMAGPGPTQALQALVKALSLEDCVDFVVEPDDLKLIELYRNASVFLFPSLYEGFGWPPLEAMACGCPVVCSSAGSLSEVVGDAALKAPAANEEEISNNCLSILKNPDLAALMSKRGKEWSSRFSIERMREDLIRVYHFSFAKSRNVTVTAE